MPNLSTLVDDFNDNTINTALWSGNYGSVSEVGGRARLTNTAGASADYHGFQSAAVYTFDDTGWYRVYPQALNGGTTTVYTAITVFSAAQPAGTSITMIHNAVSGNLSCQLRVGYTDPAPVNLTYSETTHAWWRIRRSGTNVVFETASDNAGAPGTPVVRRTATLPAWADTATDCRLMLESARQGGTQTVSEFDRVTVATPSSWDLTSPKLKEAILRFVSTVENGNQEWWTHFGYIEYGAGISDTRGYTGGIVGWTTATFDMNVLIKAYTAATPGNVLAKWIPTLDQIDALPTQDERHAASLSMLGAAFVADFQAAGETTSFKQAQLAERDRLYWTPAYNAALADNMSPLGLLHYYDTSVNHGQGASTVGGQSFQGIVATAKSQAAAPSAGGDEGTYLTKFNDAREVVLRAWGDYQAGPPAELDGRVPACRNFVAAGNFGLVTPYSWNMYGTAHRIEAWPDPYVLPAEATGVTYRSGSANFRGGNQTNSVPKPAGLTVGDLMVGVYNVDKDATTASIPTLTGWTIAGTIDRTSGTPEMGALRVLWKVATSSDVSATSFTFANPGSADSSAAILAFTAGTFNPSAPIADLTFAVDGTSRTTHTTSSAAGVANGLLLSVVGRNDTNTVSTAATWNTPAGATKRTENDGTGWVGAVTYTAPLTTTGATPTLTATCSDASMSLMASVVIAPPVGAQSPQRTVSDSAGATDTHTRSLGYGRTATSAAGASDAHSWTKTKLWSAASAAGAADSASRIMQMVRPFADSAAAIDFVTWRLDRPDISDYQFVLAAEPWQPFGLGQTIVVENFDPGTAETRPQDILSPVADTRIFGTDRRTPPTWSFDLYTDVETPAAALEWAQNMEEVWDAEGLRRSPGAVVALRYKLAGRIRRVYGRPRDFTMVPSHVRTGRVHMVADFALAENTFYDDTEDGLTVRADATIGGQTTGFTFPITFPLTVGGYREQAARVETARIIGKRPTWVDVTITGPTIDPWVRIGDLRWALRGELGNGETLTLSGKPWQQGIQRNDGTWMPGLLDPRSRLSQLRIQPGNYPVSFGGYDPTGSSKATLAWRPAYGTL